MEASKRSKAEGIAEQIADLAQHDAQFREDVLDALRAAQRRALRVLQDMGVNPDAN